MIMLSDPKGKNSSNLEQKLQSGNAIALNQPHSIKDELIKAKKENLFLKTVYALALRSLNNPKIVATEITNLHNDNLINAISEFSLLSKDLDNDIDPWILADVFKNVLPKINVSVESAMLCIKNFNKELNIDAFEATFVDFCSSSYLIPQQIIELINNLPDRWGDFLVPSIIAGTRFDIDYYCNLAIEFIHHENIEIRKRAIIALGNINYSNNLNMINRVFRSLQLSLEKENDGHLLGCLMRSIFKLYFIDKSLENKTITAFNCLLAKGGDHINSVVSELFCFSTEQLSNQLIDLLIKHLMSIPIVDKIIMIRIDSGIVRLFQRGETAQAIYFLENLLISHRPEKLDIDKFQHVISECLSNNVIFNAMVTRWFLKGNPTLCTAILKIISQMETNYPTICVDELVNCENKHIIFMARKVIGYLFSYPLVAINIMVSLINYLQDKTPDALIQLLFDPLLMNYPGEARQHLNELLKTSTEITKKIILKVLEKFDIYFKELNTINEMKELQPSGDQKEADYRYRRKIHYEISKKVKSLSPFPSSIPKKYIAFGNKSVSYRYDLNQQATRSVKMLCGWLLA